MIAHVDVSTGASGDKLCGALMQVCEYLELCDRDELAAAFAKMLPDARVEFFEKADQGMSGLGLHVHAAHHHEHGHGHGHGHRSWADIRALIEGWRDAERITAGAATRALAAFTLVAEAEASVHGTSVEEVRFHEVGAIDSIVDIVAASVMLDLLDITALYATPVVTGFGTVMCAHGELPVPAPATAKILEGVPICAGANEGEMTTPTGAALLKANVTNWEPYGAMIPVASGMGMGTRAIAGTANALRILVGQSTGAVTGWPLMSLDERDMRLKLENVVLLQTNIDHITPEIAASCCEDLLQAGALDVWQQSTAMKKGRLGMMLSVLTKPGAADELCAELCRLTGTLGVRRMLVERTVAPRSSITLDTIYGMVRYKIAEALPPAQRPEWVRPEHDEVARIARSTGRAYGEVFDELVRIWNESR